VEIKLKAEGFDRAVANLSKLTPRLQRNVIAASNRAAMRVYLNAAIPAAPVRKPKTPGSVVFGLGGKPRVPGYLRRQLKVKAVSKKISLGAISHVLHKRGAYYLRFVVQGRGGRGKGSTPNPFLSRVYTANRSRVVAAWSQEFVKRYEREVRRLHG
jgi:hypothetical protein